jgi:catechol 2,3-dioxygenase
MTDTGGRPFGIAPPGYRLPSDTRLGTVRLQVSSLERSLEYYEQVLGFRILARDATAATLAPFGEDRGLIVLVEWPGARPAPPGRVIGLYHFAILLPDRAALGRYITHLARAGVRAGSADHAVSEALYLTDPDGLGIEVYADRPRSTWRLLADRQLHMTVAPLDFNGVVAAAGDVPWTGMPAGTTLGHMHLHVADIDQAAAFYHAGLGFDKIVWEYPGALFLSAGGYHHHLGTNTWASGPPAAADQARLLSWELVVPSVTDVAEVAASLDAITRVERQSSGVIIATDPWGNQLRVVASAR